MNLLLGSVAMGLLLSLLALGVLVTFRVLRTLDLTADGAFGLGAAITVAMLARGAGPIMAALGAALAGAGAGWATGVMHARLRIETLLAGIITSTAVYSVMVYAMGGGDLAVGDRPTLFALAERLWPADASTSPLAAGWTSLALLVVLAVAVALALRAFLATRLGLAVRAVGDNAVMARVQGIDVGRTMTLGLVLANALIALSGALFAQYQGFANVQMGIGMLITGLACVALGEALFGARRIRTQILATVAGAITFRLLVAAALRSGLPPDALKLATAAFLLAVLALPRLARSAAPFRAIRSGDG